MPKRTDIQRILVIGSGPIVIGQACEFDYSGTQAIKALKAQGYEVILVNSNPATIMTDPQLCDQTYIEPLTIEYLTEIIQACRPNAMLATMGGQTALNLALALEKQGVLQQYGVQLLGVHAKTIEIAEDRALFAAAMQEIGLSVPHHQTVCDVASATAFAEQSGYPVIIRPSYTMGGSGGGIAYNAPECETIVQRGLQLSPVHQVLVEESVIGWKEYELEIICDNTGCGIVVCTIENVDPMGVHTGDSVTVAPAQTLSDQEYQSMRNAALQIMQRVGLKAGGANVQFAVNPQNGRMIVIEMNPRVSRSSALASKATGFPIAKIAALLSVGYHLAEITNDIAQCTPAAFEPALDYVVTKIPKFAFEKFPGADATLGTQMKSVGEVIAIGRTFKESLGKALRAIEINPRSLPQKLSESRLTQLLTAPNEHRLQVAIAAMEQGQTAALVTRLTHIDPWFVDQMQQLAQMQRLLRGKQLADVPLATLTQAKQWGFSDLQLAELTHSQPSDVRKLRHKLKLRPVYKRIDTCAAEFSSDTPYLYSTYETTCESRPEAVRKVLILGSGPNRIGQGIEFDYCCSHAAQALAECGVQSIMINCNPETVSTDYDTSDRLYLEPLTLEDVLEIADIEEALGVIVQLGGQTPLNLTWPLAQAGVRILGTPAESIRLAEDRQRFNSWLKKLGILYPAHGFAQSAQEAAQIAQHLGYPILVRPSFVLGGRAMAIVYEEADLQQVVSDALTVNPDNALLIDKFLENALEYDVDALCDGKYCIIAGIMEHIEEAGVHSGDSCSVLPADKLSAADRAQISDITRKIALELGVIGLMNIQVALAQGQLYVLEVNPRASRTVPYLAKATGVPLANLATKLMLGQTLSDLGLTQDLSVDSFFVKAPVFPFVKFPGVDPKLSPEMRSTGEVMGVDTHLGAAFYKALLAAGMRLPTHGNALITVNQRDHHLVVPIAKRLHELGFVLFATYGNAQVLRGAGLPVKEVLKCSEGRPNCVDSIRSGQIALIINTPLGALAYQDGWAIRTAAIAHNVPLITTLAGATAAVQAIDDVQKNKHLNVTSLQQLHPFGKPGYVQP